MTHWIGATKRKCWYVGSLGRSAEEAAPATKGRATHWRPMSVRPNRQSQADHPSLSPSEAGPSSPPVKVIADKPNAASVSETADDATSSNSGDIRSQSKHLPRNCTDIKRCAREQCDGRRLVDS